MQIAGEGGGRLRLAPVRPPSPRGIAACPPRTWTRPSGDSSPFPGRTRPPSRGSAMTGTDRLMFPRISCVKTEPEAAASLCLERAQRSPVVRGEGYADLAPWSARLRQAMPTQRPCMGRAERRRRHRQRHAYARRRRAGDPQEAPRPHGADRTDRRPWRAAPAGFPTYFLHGNGRLRALQHRVFTAKGRGPPWPGSQQPPNAQSGHDPGRWPEARLYEILTPAPPSFTPS